jgi:hypothetical protein
MQKAPPMGLSLAAVVLGLLIAWIGSRPSWVDTFITAGVIFLTAALFGVFRPSQALLWALAIGAWVPPCIAAMARSLRWPWPSSERTPGLWPAGPWRLPAQDDVWRRTRRALRGVVSGRAKPARYRAVSRRPVIR